MAIFEFKFLLILQLSTRISSIYGPIFCDRFRVCQGPYDAELIRAWEDWDLKHGSENDHPKEFPDKQVSFLTSSVIRDEFTCISCF